MSFIRPRLEYATPVWDPNCQNLHQAILYKTGPTCTYEELLTNSKLQTLKDRRLSLNLSYLFQVLNGSFIFPNAPLSLHQIRNSDSQLLERPVTQTNVYKYSYFPHVISLWNKLPLSLHNCTSLPSFKYSLHQHFMS